MSVTRTSSLSSEVLISSGDPEADDYYLVHQTSDTDTSVGVIDGSTSGGTTTTALVDATAFGTDTLAAASGSVTVADEGATTTTSVDLEALAVAQSSDDLAFASTSIDMTYAGGGGPSVSLNHDHTSLEVEDGQTTMVSTSSLSFVVIDLGGGSATTSEELYAPADAELLPDDGTDGEPLDDGCTCLDDGQAGYSFDLDGNVALFDVTASAFGENTYADLQLDAFAVEDAMSTVTMVITVAVE